MIKHHHDNTEIVSDWSLELVNVSKWRQDLCLFDQLSFQMNRPILHIAGANGSGKTSLLNLISGISRPDDGQIVWHHRDHEVSVRQGAAQVAFCGHKEALNPDLSVLENIAWAASLGGGATEQSVEALLESHHLSHLLDQRARTLSAGQRRRVCLLRAVSSKQDIWVWDEPYANLDADGRSWVDQLILAHIHSGGIALITTHQDLSLSQDWVQEVELN